MSIPLDRDQVPLADSAGRPAMTTTIFYEMLCCPKCRSGLSLIRDQSAFSCAKCNFVFPIIDGIPVLFPCNVEEDMKYLFTRYWDSEDNAHLYDANVEGAGGIFGVYNHKSEVAGLTCYFDKEKLDLVLDAGCGNGRFLETLPRQTVSIGVDASLNLLRAARRRRRGDFLVCCELEHLPFRNDLFSTVISCRVIQHLREQERAVLELCRVTRDHGDLILELYNTWNPKTLWKQIRMSKIRLIFNAPFKLLFRSLSPFSEWGIAYDNYNHWFEVKRWLKHGNMHGLRGRGVGFGFHKYLFDAFFVNGILEKRAPRLLRRYYAMAFTIEKLFGAAIPLRYVMEKVVMKATKNASELDRGLLRRAIRRVDDALKNSDRANRVAREELAREKKRQDIIVRENRFHITEAVRWLARAQDAASDGGVPRAYSAAGNPHTGGIGWQPSYPETTGYIIPTMFDCAQYLKDPDLRRRALQMADWEIDVQMPNGAVMGGVLNPNPSPAVFNTGQVMLGWVRAYDETNEPRYLDACRRGAEFLLSVQDPDGCWRKWNSRFASATATTYNARVGWAMILVGQRLDDQRLIDAGERNIQFSIARQASNGWFFDNCLSDPNAPLLHTICYAIEGLLGAAAALRQEQFFSKGQLAAEALLRCLREDGSIAGRLDASWNGKVQWSCLTGDAQLAGVWLQIFAKTRNTIYQTSARRVLAFLKSTQNCSSPEPGIRGGIKGAYPFDGGYGRFELLSWATKFFVDALIMDERLTATNAVGSTER